VAALLLAGCTQESFLQPAAYNDWAERPSENVELSVSLHSAEGSVFTPPHTLPQAIRAYFRCLCYGQPPTKNQAISQTAEQEQSKNPPAEGKSSESKNGKNADTNSRNGEQKQSKNPPTENGSAGKENGKDADKENAEEQWYSRHAQATVVTQTHDPFRSP